jgi:hypothetical protein
MGLRNTHQISTAVISLRTQGFPEIMANTIYMC